MQIVKAPEICFSFKLIHAIRFSMKSNLGSYSVGCFETIYCMTEVRSELV